MTAQIPSECDVADVTGACCDGPLNARGRCCPSGSMLDADGACCEAGVLDACGACDGVAVAVDAAGACCAKAPLDAQGLCCEVELRFAYEEA